MKRTDWQTESNCEWVKVWQTEVDSQAERKKDRKRKKESGHRDSQEESLLATKVPEHFTSRQNHNLLQFDKKVEEEFDWDFRGTKTKERMKGKNDVFSGKQNWIKIPNASNFFSLSRI